MSIETTIHRLPADLADLIVGALQAEANECLAKRRRIGSPINLTAAEQRAKQRLTAREHECHQAIAALNGDQGIAR